MEKKEENEPKIVAMFGLHHFCHQSPWRDWPGSLTGLM